MTDDMIELGRRAVAAKRWAWRPGMKVWWRLDHEDETYPIRLHGWPNNYPTDPDDDEPIYPGHNDAEDESNGWGFPRDAGCYPDLSDPATLGCVLALVREACGEDCAYACVVGVHGDGSPKWAVRDIRHGAFAGLQSEAAALVAALESAP